MRTKRLILTLSIAIVAITSITFLTSMNYSSEYFVKTKNAVHFAMENITGLNLDIVIPEKQDPAIKEKNQVKSGNALNMNWAEMGPDNIGGRTRAVLVDRDDQNVIFAGSVGGGLWKSTTSGLSWEKVTGNDQFDNMMIVTLCQAPNGDMYFGTGEYFGSGIAEGFRGQGIYKSTDHGQNWALLTSTWNSSDDSKDVFYFVSKLAIDPNNSDKIYAATAKGLRISSNGGVSWTNPISDSNANSICTDVQVSSDGQVVVISLNHQAYVSNAGNDSFTLVSGANSNQIPLDVCRLEFAIAPSNSNYIYCLAAENSTSNYGGLKNVYQSTDKGATWTQMIPIVNNQFKPFGDERLGRYQNVIKVFPDDPEHIILGGTDLYTWSPNEPWQQVSYSGASYPGAYSYVQSGIHTLFFPTNYSSTNKILYVGTDGGVFKGTYYDGAGFGWNRLYKNYNTTQFYSVSYSSTGKIIGGSRNNGTLILPQDLTNAQDAVKILAGNAGYCEFSNLNPNFIFATGRYGTLGRSYDEGRSINTLNADIFPTDLTSAVSGIGTDVGQPLVTPIRLWESFYDPNSTQEIMIESPKKLVFGDTLQVVSPCQRTIYHIINNADLNGQDTIFKGDTLYVQDTYQSMLAIGFNGSVWISREANNMALVPPNWYRPSNMPMKQIQTLEFSADGDILYFADYSATGDTSRLYRTSNLTNGRDYDSGDYHSSTNVTVTQAIGTFPHRITGIGVDPQNSNNVIVTIGGYNNTDYIYYSNNAATTTSSVMADNFVSKQGDLEQMPVYTGIIRWDNSQVVILGTESGVYATDDITATSPNWVEQNTNGLAHVPVMQLRQQIHRNGWLPAPVTGNGLSTDVTNHGYIYAATFGRGIYVCDDFKGPVSVPEITAENKTGSNFVIYPNPVKDIANVSYTLDRKSDVNVNVYDIKGNLVKEINLKNVNSGKQTLNFSTHELSSGTYIATMVVNGTKNSVKFIVK